VTVVLDWTVDKHALKRDAEKVGLLATEGGLLANDVSRGASTQYSGKRWSGSRAIESSFGTAPRSNDAVPL
jgi:hypothetical protein